MKTWKPLFAVLLSSMPLVACGEAPETEPAKVSAVVTSACTGTTPNYYVDVYSDYDFRGTCKRVAPYSYVPDAVAAGLRPYSVKVGARAELHVYTLPGPAGVGGAMGPSYQILAYGNLFQNVLAFALYPTGRTPNNGIPRPCDSTTVPGPYEMILYNGTHFTGICSIFASDGLNYAYFPDMSVYGWDIYQFPIASIRMGSAANTTTFNHPNFDTGGPPPGVLMAGWSFDHSFSFWSAYML